MNRLKSLSKTISLVSRTSSNRIKPITLKFRLNSSLSDLPKEGLDLKENEESEFKGLPKDMEESWRRFDEEGFGDEESEVSMRYHGKGGNFTDFKLIQVMGGKGGDGTVSFHRDKITANGPPDGGNGGWGGDVYLRATSNESTLSMIKYRCRAKNGANGKGKGMHGPKGKDLIIVVPVGTIIKEIDPPKKKDENGDTLGMDQETSDYVNKVQELTTDLSSLYKIYPAMKDAMLEFPVPNRLKHQHKAVPYEKVFLDLAEEGDYLIAKGGKGGYGNPHFSSGEKKSAMIAERGLEGEVKYLELELKTIADCGLVGMPNAGKSTFLAAVSNAHPKIAPYPFTTINPYLGTIDYPDLKQIKLADIPGLIPGAHKNLGLGHAFLRHIERSKVLVYVIDLSNPQPHLDLQILMNELEQYQPNLTKRPSMIIANKADLSNANKLKLSQFKAQIPKGMVVVPVSAKLKKNITKATSILRQLVTSNEPSTSE